MEVDMEVDIQDIQDMEVPVDILKTPMVAILQTLVATQVAPLAFQGSQVAVEVWYAPQDISVQMQIQKKFVQQDPSAHQAPTLQKSVQEDHTHRKGRQHALLVHKDINAQLEQQEQQHP